MPKSEMTFTASMQVAIQWVNTHLLYPSQNSRWERPNWSNFTWFTKIEGGDIWGVEEPQPFQKDGDIYVRRNINFFLGRDMVATVNMQGLRYNGSTSWSVREVNYRITWGHWIDELKWVSANLLISNYSGLPPLLSPED